MFLWEVRKFPLLSQPTLRGWSPVSGTLSKFFPVIIGWTAPLVENIQYQQREGGGGGGLELTP